MLKIPSRFKQCDLSVSLAFDYCDCIVNMGTRSAAFTVKIRSLYDFHLRFLYGAMPPPSGVDISNTIKYFSQTLLTILRDVPNSPIEILRNPEMDSVRMGLFPGLDYKGLYNSLVPLIEIAPLIQYGLHNFGEAILQCLSCLLPFLENDFIESLPNLIASSMAVLPNSLHQDIVNTLCFYILPFTIVRNSDREIETSHSLSSVIALIFQYSSNPAHHCQFLECLMALKKTVLRDILCVIAYGTSAVRSSAAKLLFYYWPAFNPNLFDRKGLICKLGGDSVPFTCQRDLCPNPGTAEAAKICYNQYIAITFACEKPPPIYLCIECANEIHREYPNQQFFDILHPMQQVSMVCENKNCRSTDKSAMSMCFSMECASYNGNRPIRYCQLCLGNRHNLKRGGDHIYHKCIPPTWTMDREMQIYMVEAIVSLLKESKLPSQDTREHFEGKTILPPIDNISIDERILLGRYGVWLLVGRCTPDENTSDDIMGRLMAMLFHWFHMTAYSYDGQEESTLEKLKTETVCAWLKELSNTHYNLFLSCLLAHPPEYARVGGHWDTLATRTSHLKDGLNRLFCLIPYEVVTQETWDYIMPHWMEAIVNDVPEKEIYELKIIINKVLEIDMSPLGFTAWEMYNFVAVRFRNTLAKDQEQALRWLQALTKLELTIPLYLLFSIFGDGVRTMKDAQVEEVVVSDKPISPKEIDAIEGPSQSSAVPLADQCDSGDTSLSNDEGRMSQPAELKTDSENNLFCCIMMLDTLLKQMELQDIDKHTGLNSELCKDVCKLLKCMVKVTWSGNHICSTKSDCGYCESSTIWHQLCWQLVKYISPETLAYPPDPPLDENGDDIYSRRSPPESDKKDSKSEMVMNIPLPEVHSVGGVLVHMPHVCSIMTATVETVSEQLDLTAIMPSEKSGSIVAKSITLADSDTGLIFDDAEEPLSKAAEDDPDNIWHTSLGKFKFSIIDLPEQLQYMYELLLDIPKIEKADVVCYILQCLNTLCLYGDACGKASREHRGFFIWCQENLLIRNLWNICNSEYSHIGQEAVPLLLHCITLPAGSDVFWRVIQEEFHSMDWRIRFAAVERVTVIARFMDSTPLRNIPNLQAALANAFCYFTSSMDDTNVYVAQKATLFLGTLHDLALKSLIMCLETQFDTVIIDRPMVLQSIYQLHNSLSERRILSWDFFLNRFDTLFLEAQINMEKPGDTSCLRDLKNNDVNSEVFLRKLNRVQEALSQSDGSGASSIRTLNASFGTKWPYKRTMSAPASIVPRLEFKELKEKVYNRQYSAPILKRKSSRFGLDGQSQSLNVVDDQNIIGFLYRVIDFEEADKETMHLLIFLLMQFLSRSDQAYPAEERSMTKSQGIVLRHLYLLLGYCQTDRGIYIPPQRLRISSAFNAFLSNLPQLLDQNYLMGRALLPTTLILLQYAPAPYYIGSGLEFQLPAYSLWHLEPHGRRSWLLSLVVLLYKYQYNQEPHCLQLSSLIKIVINTLDTQHHRCRKIPPTLIMGPPPSRSRDVSQPSLGTEADHERITPPLSPMYSLDGHSCQISLSSKTGKVQISYTKPSSTTSMETHWEEIVELPERKLDRGPKKVACDADDSESDLLAIPESDISDSTLQGSAEDSLEETVEDAWQSKSEALLSRRTALSDRRPTWFIGNEEDISESQYAILPHCKWFSTDNNKSCVRVSSLGTSSLASTLAVVAGVPNIQVAMAKTITTDSHKHITTACIETHHDGKQASVNRTKKTVESSSTILYASECDTSIKNDQSQVLPAPSFERLLPIGSVKSPVLKGCRPIFTEFDSRSPDSPLSKMEIMIIESPKEKIPPSNIDTELELPQHERLLPIGQHKDISQLIDKVKHALGIESHTPKILENRQSFQEDVPPSHSPRRLIKQVALESPPSIEEDLEESIFCDDIIFNNKRDYLLSQRQNIRKSAIFAIGAHCLSDTKELGSWYSPHLSPRVDRNELKQSCFRIGEDCVNERCSECGIIKEEYSDEEIGLCMVTLGTFIHKEPILASPFLPDILRVVSKLTANSMYPWQTESTMHLPGGALSVAHQFLRCVLYQLTPNGIFTQMFQTHVHGKSRMHFFKSVTQALTDFSELNPITPLQFLLEALNCRKTLPIDVLSIILENMACYFECLPLEASLGTGSTLWSNVLLQLESLFRRILLHLNAIEATTPLLRIMISVLKIPIIPQYKGLLEPFSKVLSHAILAHTVKYSHLMDLCSLCNRAFIRERDKLILSRMAVFELVQALKFKSSIPDSNILILIALILQDSGGSLPINVIVRENLPLYNENSPMSNTSVSDCMRLHLGDVVEFLTDFHTLTKLKSYSKGVNTGINEDTIGGLIKGSVAQYLALEVTKGNGRENRAITKYFPWLCGSAAVQQTLRDFMESIGHVRLFSWILLGSLTHSTLHGIAMSQHFCQPIPQDASCLIADLIQVILVGFSEQPKTSVIHMSSLFHSFILCQLWTIYLEQSLNTHIPASEAYNTTMNILFEFWGKITPSILSLVQQSKMMAEIVSLHFLNMLEALLECHSALIGKLLPLWTTVLCSNNIQLPGHLQVRLQNCRNFSPNTNYEVLSEKTKYVLSNPVLLKSLQRLQFKMGQIELQSSVASQFYSL